MRRSIKRAFVTCAVIMATLILFSASTAGKEPEGAPIVVPPSPLVQADSGDEAEKYIIPDPCGLDVVYCDGEEMPEVTPYLAPAWREVTAYTSEASQTDGSPCIAADGSNVCERWQDGEVTCAANFVPFGTVLILDNQEEPDGEDAIVCTVADRLSSRYPNRVDLYMGYDTARAMEFGIKTLFIKEYGTF